jgi:CMP-N-acetylneuraminic acid synthetase
MTTLAIIPARAGSTRLKDKNLETLDGSEATLIDRAVLAALDAGCRVVISTDYPQSYVMRPQWPEGVLYHRRPENLCGATVDLDQVVADAVRAFERHWNAPNPYLANTDITAPLKRVYQVVTLQPATPLRSAKLIRDMLTTMRRARCVAALTMARCVPWTWRIEAGAASNTWSPSPYPRSQDVRYHNLQEINTVQIANRDVVLSGKRWDLPLLITELPAWAVLDIDTAEDLDECRALWPVLKPRLDAIDTFPFHVAHTVNGEHDLVSPMWTVVPKSLPGMAS